MTKQEKTKKTKKRMYLYGECVIAVIAELLYNKS